VTYDQTLDGSGNGAGGRFNDSTAQVLAKQQASYAAETKAATEPHLLTDADIPNLSGATISRLMSAGALGHLGLGGRRKQR
jgi:hypothetical protein